MTCEAGVVLAKAQAAAAAADRLFPLSLGAEGSCTIGGNLFTNAGGTGTLAYGVARDLVLGLEVVLADGRILPLAGATGSIQRNLKLYDVIFVHLSDPKSKTTTRAEIRVRPAVLSPIFTCRRAN